MLSFFGGLFKKKPKNSSDNTNNNEEEVYNGNDQHQDHHHQQQISAGNSLTKAHPYNANNIYLHHPVIYDAKTSNFQVVGIAPSMRIPDMLSSNNNNNISNKHSRKQQALILSRQNEEFIACSIQKRKGSTVVDGPTSKNRAVYNVGSNSGAASSNGGCSQAVLFSFGESNTMRGMGKPLDTSSAEGSLYTRTPFKICSVVLGYTCSVALTADGYVLACGSNSNGQIGSERMDDGSNEYFRLVEKLCEEEIVQASCGYYFSLFLTRNGTVIGSGDNSHGQLGTDPYLSKVIMEKLKTNNPIRSIHAGYYHSIMIDMNGKAYACGQSFSRNIEPVKGLENENVTSASGGYDYSFFITQRGEVYGCGELGHMVFGESNGKSQITKILGFNHHVISSSSGYYHTLFTTAEGVIYSCGRNQYNSLNRKVEETIYNNAGQECKLLEHKHMKNIVQVSCGGYHSAALDSEGKTYLFGHSGFNQSLHDESAQPGVFKTTINDVEMETMPESMIITTANGKQLRSVSVGCGGWNTIIVCSPYIPMSSSKNEKEMFSKLKQYISESIDNHHLFDVGIVAFDPQRR